MKKFAPALVLGALIGFVPTTAQAGTVDISVFTGQSANLTSAYFNGGTTAGSVTISDVQGLSPLVNGSTFISFCVDLQHTIAPPVNNQNATLDFMSNWDGFGVFVPQANAGRYAAYLYNIFAGFVTTNDQRAGLGLAIWNVLYDNDFTVSAGVGFSATSTPGAVNLANAVLGVLSANTSNALTHDAYWIRTYPVNGDPDAAPQDFIGPVGPSTTTFNTVPDGGTTLALLGGALMGLGVFRRKFSI